MVLFVTTPVIVLQHHLCATAARTADLAPDTQGLKPSARFGVARRAMHATLASQFMNAFRSSNCACKSHPKYSCAASHTPNE
jgi:hypothetical protein